MTEQPCHPPGPALETEVIPVIPFEIELYLALGWQLCPQAFPTEAVWMLPPERIAATTKGGAK